MKSIKELKAMSDEELAVYFFPNYIACFPEKATTAAAEARRILKTTQGKQKLESLRQEYEDTINIKREKEGLSNLANSHRIIDKEDRFIIINKCNVIRESSSVSSSADCYTTCPYLETINNEGSCEYVCDLHSACKLQRKEIKWEPPTKDNDNPYDEYDFVDLDPEYVSLEEKRATNILFKTCPLSKIILNSYKG